MKAPKVSDPMDSIPASPTQIYRNMLVLEESLRSQYIALRVRRYKYTLFCALLVLWTLYFYYGVFIWCSVYAYVHLFHKLCLMIGVVTLSLFYLSGLYSKTMVYPRKFLSNTNKGLRQFNLKVVSTHSSTSKAFVAEATRAFKIAFYKIWYRPRPPPSSYHTDSTSSLHSAQAHHQQGSHRRRSSSNSSSNKPPLASKTSSARLPYYHYYYYHHKPPGGDVVKIVMLPKAFSAEFREGWEVYRQEYWEKENERRAGRASGLVPCSCTYNDQNGGGRSSR
ncbi:Sporulation/nuclear morphology [Lipomyces kononenkoae]|uniref:Sporulation/nuclear morphology n=1 Tax=Lipomyces kononenkoae TaxID=34357 RepID=A0ACC3T9B6_LIPKO